MCVCVFQDPRHFKSLYLQLQGILSVLVISLGGGGEQPDGSMKSPLNTSLC